MESCSGLGVWEEVQSAHVLSGYKIVLEPPCFHHSESSLNYVPLGDY